MCYITDLNESRRIMIRLIASDMDGTLLDSRKQLPEETFRMIETLCERGIAFVVASGRQYYNLYNLFGDVADRICYCSENGAIVFRGKENLFFSELPRSGAERILEEIRRLPRVYPILCGLNSAYIVDDDPEFVRNARFYNDRLERIPVSAIREVLEADRICKIAAFSARDAEAVVYPALRVLSSAFSVVLSGMTWVDIMNPEVSKGAALDFLRNRLGISSGECMVFGDYLNDSSMFLKYPNSYAMANAHPGLKEIAAHITEADNEHDGVWETVRRELQKELRSRRVSA